MGDWNRTLVRSSRARLPAGACQREVAARIPGRCEARTSGRRGTEASAAPAGHRRRARGDVRGGTAKDRMMFRLQALRALEVLDSRGRPTVAAACCVNDAWGEVSVPAGASTGAGEALDLRDGNPSRYAGLGCLRAVSHVTGEIAAALVGQKLPDQAALDSTLVELDGTPDKSRLGANATLAVSLAFARACAAARGVPLYRHFADIAGVARPALPQLTVNLFSGGKHAGGQMSVQDVLVVPLGPTGVGVALERVVAVVRAAEKLVVEKYHERPLKADEGGLAPPFPSVEEALDDAVT